MSRGGRHGYSFRVEKSYWLHESQSSHETDCDLKRKGNAISGPPKKKIRTEVVENVPNETILPVNENKSSIVASDSQPQIKICECMNGVDCHQYITNEMFDDVESVGSKYDGENAFITELFNSIDNVPSDITNVSDVESSYFPDILNIFGDIPSEDDEDRVIITEIFDDIETSVPDVNCSTCKNVSNKQ